MEPNTDSLFHCGLKRWTQISSFWDDVRQENLILCVVVGQEIDGYCLPSLSASVNTCGTQCSQPAAQSNKTIVITVPLVILYRYHCSEMSGIMQVYFSCFQFIKMFFFSASQIYHIHFAKFSIKTDRLPWQLRINSCPFQLHITFNISEIKLQLYIRDGETDSVSLQNHFPEWA
jgi:hypothetical protein